MRRLLAPLVIAAIFSTSCLALTTHDGPWACSTNKDCMAGEVCRTTTSSRKYCLKACSDSAQCGSPNLTCKDEACMER